MLTPWPQPGDDLELIAFLLSLASWSAAAGVRAWMQPVDEAAEFVRDYHMDVAC